jgi:hypothetical protein
VLHRRSGQIAGTNHNMNSEEQTRHVTTAERRGISDQIAKLNYSRITKIIRGDQETNSNQGQGFKETAITAKNLDTNKTSIEQGLIR